MKHPTLRALALSSALASALAGSTWSSELHAADLERAANARQTYLIRFPEPGVARYEGSVPGLARTAPQPGERLQAQSRAAQDYREHLLQQQAADLASISALIGRTPEVTHSYVYTHSGMAMRLTANEAAEIERMFGPGSIEADKEYKLETFRGPSFIGADNVWNLPLDPPGTSQGRGVVIGVLDSGVNALHPSFANDPDCGFSAPSPKLLSAVDCSTSAGGVCTGGSPADTNGHGTHTASTAGGNILTALDTPPPTIPAPYTQISGVAPCATLRTYKVCPGSSCPGSAIAAGIDHVLAHGDVDVMNFSISGGLTPWTDFDRDFLDIVTSGTFIAASAGNNSDADPTVIGRVNHRGPWVMSVAASTHDEIPIGGSVSATGTATPPANTQDITLSLSGLNTGTSGNYQLRYDPTNIYGCTDLGGFDAGFFDGAIALIQRGPPAGMGTACSFEEKINNADAAGAEVVFIYNHSGGGVFGMLLGTATAPAYAMAEVDGLALRAFIDANAANPTLVDFEAAVKQGNVLADFSLRGPTPAPLADLTKPDITGPGVNILAAGPDNTTSPYATLSGTSMSGPHVAGAGALVRAVRPSWTPMEVKSALQLTAAPPGTLEDGVTPWTPDQVGNGLVRPDLAIEAGLVMDESTANFLAANPSGGSISVRDLNIPSMRNLACTPTCVFTRTFTGTIPGGQNWLVGYEGDPDVNVQIDPSTFSVAEGADQEVTFTISPNGAQPATLFGAITLTATGAPVRSLPPFPVLRLTVAIAGTGPDANYVFANGFE